MRLFLFIPVQNSKAKLFERGRINIRNRYFSLAFILTTASLITAQSPSSAFLFPFGDSLYKFPGAKGTPERVQRFQGSALSRSWDYAEGGAVIAADTKGGRFFGLSP